MVSAAFPFCPKRLTTKPYPKPLDAESQPQNQEPNPNIRKRTQHRMMTQNLKCNTGSKLPCKLPKNITLWSCILIQHWTTTS